MGNSGQTRRTIPQPKQHVKPNLYHSTTTQLLGHLRAADDAQIYLRCVRSRRRSTAITWDSATAIHGCEVTLPRLSGSIGNQTASALVPPPSHHPIGQIQTSQRRSLHAFPIYACHTHKIFRASVQFMSFRTHNLPRSVLCAKHHARRLSREGGLLGSARRLRCNSQSYR